MTQADRLCIKVALLPVVTYVVGLLRVRYPTVIRMRTTIPQGWRVRQGVLGRWLAVDSSLAKLGMLLR